MRVILATSQKIKRHQRTFFAIVVGVLLMSGILLFAFGLETPPPKKEKMNEGAPIYDVTKAVDDKSFWVFKSESKLAEQEKKQNQLMGEIETLRDSLKKPESDESKNQMETLQDRVQALEQKLFQPISSVTPEPKETDDSMSTLENTFQNTFTAPVTPPSPPSMVGLPQPGGIFSEALTLSHPSDETTRQHMDNTIPAGSYVKAVLLSGVDVSVGVSSQTNPEPVLLKLVHPGSLPNHMIGKMKDCRMIAAAYGELSSERAKFRLEKLSCIQPDGHVIETDVDGFISGEDGKNGMRGRVVIRDAEVLKRGFMGGLLSGLGKATSQSFQSTSVSPLGAVSTVNRADIFKQAGAEGAANAFEMMAKYNIQRAEQYQPVIQISAKREVYAVFHSGSKFGERKVKPMVNPTQKTPDTLFGE